MGTDILYWWQCYRKMGSNERWTTYNEIQKSKKVETFRRTNIIKTIKQTQKMRTEQEQKRLERKYFWIGVWEALLPMIVGGIMGSVIAQIFLIVSPDLSGIEFLLGLVFGIGIGIITGLLMGKRIVKNALKNKSL